MKTIISTTLVALFMTSTSNAFCMKQFSKQMNRYSASSMSTAFKPGVQQNSTSTKAVAVNSTITGRK